MATSHSLHQPDTGRNKETEREPESVEKKKDKPTGPTKGQHRRPATHKESQFFFRGRRSKLKDKRAQQRDRVPERFPRLEDNEHDCSYRVVKDDEDSLLALQT